MFTSETLLKGELPDVSVGIGRGTDAGNVERSVAAMSGHDVRVYSDPEALAEDLVRGRIDAAVRGDMSSSRLLPVLRSSLGLREIERAVFMEPTGGKLILAAPVGIDEGWTVEQKHEMAVRSVVLMRRLGMGTRIAVMSGGRCEDYGRNPAVDATMRDALSLVEILVSEGYDAYHSQILIESAVREADLIIAPDGITGNLIFRIMHFIGGAKALGAPVINTDKVFVDTSRVKTDYADSIALAMKLTGGNI
ncbi:MAG: methanogenesis marker protein Mmp4/MtxX [Candidatus Methanomethylophilaceae archaeon]|jgi:putative methanogen marker protein 4|nr:methanogenesis marker protein Mmp4/MtxX [Candidatus Methanomethylophilaceae archaeon]NLF33665.1 methanogenesis marker protein Mmp4/MtxX [Thermoplasmatales archaeon]